MNKAVALAIILLAMIGLSSCESEPRPPVEDPKAYAIEALQTMDLNTWWQAYRNPDPTLLGQFVDEAAADQPDGLPTDARQLDTFINNHIAPRYKLYMDDTDEGKAFILAQAEARFVNPPMALLDSDNDVALLDYHVLPGEWKSISRLSEGLVNPPAIGTSPFLRPDILADSLQKLVAAYPDARVYQIRYQYHLGSDLKRVLMEFAPHGYLVYKIDANIAFTPEPVSWDDLLNGDVDLAELTWDTPMEDNPAPSMANPPDEPLLFKQ